MRFRLRIAIILISFLTPSSPLFASDYVWAVVPQFTGVAVHRDWTPLLERLGEETGHTFSLRIYDTIPEFERSFLDGEPDFAYMNPYHAVVASRRQGYIPIVRNGARLLQGIVVVRADSPIKSVQDLDGKNIAFPSPNAFAASMLIRALLTEKEKIVFNAEYVGTHSNAYRFTLTGQTAATGAVKRTLGMELAAVRDALRIIYETEKSPSHPITAHPRVPDKTRMAVQETILKMVDTNEGSKILEAILLSPPIAADYTRDYQPLEALDLSKYWVEEK